MPTLEVRCANLESLTSLSSLEMADKQHLLMGLIIFAFASRCVLVQMSFYMGGQHLHIDRVLLGSAKEQAMHRIILLASAKGLRTWMFELSCSSFPSLSAEPFFFDFFSSI